jgi:hypothetical protein
MENRIKTERNEESKDGRRTGRKQKKEEKTE